MYCKCPHCLTIFSVDAGLLNLRQGMVRCGNCQQVFNGNWNLLEQLPGDTVLTEESGSPTSPGGTDAGNLSEVDAEIVDDQDPLQSVRVDTIDDEIMEMEPTSVTGDSDSDEPGEFITGVGVEFDPETAVGELSAEAAKKTTEDQSGSHRRWDDSQASQSDSRSGEQDADASTYDDLGSNLPDLDTLSSATGDSTTPPEAVEVDTEAALTNADKTTGEEKLYAETGEFQFGFPGGDDVFDSPAEVSRLVEEIEEDIQQKTGKRADTPGSELTDDVLEEVEEHTNLELSENIEALASVFDTTDGHEPEDASVVVSESGQSDAQTVITNTGETVPDEEIVLETTRLPWGIFNDADKQLAEEGIEKANDNQTAARSAEILDEPSKADASVPLSPRHSKRNEPILGPLTIPEQERIQTGQRDITGNTQETDKPPPPLKKIKKPRRKDANLGRIPSSTAGRTRSAFWSLSFVFLLLLLGYQLKDQYLEDLGAADWVRPVMEQGCKWFDCEVPHRGDIGSLELLETRINPHPETPGALRMSASIINRADFSQAYPRLQITLTNKIGRIVGRRDYGAQEYLGVEYVNRKSLAPGVVEFIALDLAHPDESAVGYEVEIVAGG